MLQIVCRAVIGLCLLASILIFPSYVGAAFPKKVKKSLRMKMILSTLFILTAASSAVLAKNTSPFAALMLAGFVFAWIGDLILGKGDSTRIFLTGTVSFFATHLLYIAALLSALRHLFPTLPFFTLPELIVFLVVAFLVGLMCVLRKARFHKLLPPLIVYMAALVVMFVKACTLGFKLYPNSRAALLLPVGAFFFLYSDVTLGMLHFHMHKKVFSFRACCSVSYFVGQLLIAMSLAVIAY